MPYKGIEHEFKVVHSNMNMIVTVDVNINSQGTIHEFCTITVVGDFDYESGEKEVNQFIIDFFNDPVKHITESRMNAILDTLEGFVSIKR